MFTNNTATPLSHVDDVTRLISLHNVGALHSLIALISAIIGVIPAIRPDTFDIHDMDDVNVYKATREISMEVTHCTGCKYKNVSYVDCISSTVDIQSIEHVIHTSTDVLELTDDDAATVHIADIDSDTLPVTVDVVVTIADTYSSSPPETLKSSNRDNWYHPRTPVGVVVSYLNAYIQLHQQSPEFVCV